MSKEHFCYDKIIRIDQIPNKRELRKINKLEAENTKLREDHLLQLAAISTASMCNTEKSMESSLIGKDNPYWTVAYSDTVNAVKREVLLLAESARLKAELVKERKLIKTVLSILSEAGLSLDGSDLRVYIDDALDDIEQRQKERDQSILK